MSTIFRSETWSVSYKLEKSSDRNHSNTFSKFELDFGRAVDNIQTYHHNPDRPSESNFGDTPSVSPRSRWLKRDGTCNKSDSTSDLSCSQNSWNILERSSTKHKFYQMGTYHNEIRYAWTQNKLRLCAGTLKSRIGWPRLLRLKLSSDLLGPSPRFYESLFSRLQCILARYTTRGNPPRVLGYSFLPIFCPPFGFPSHNEQIISATRFLIQSKQHAFPSIIDHPLRARTDCYCHGSWDLLKIALPAWRRW